MRKNSKIFISFFFVSFGIFPNFIVLNACNKQLAFSIKYGDEINCLDPKKDKFISIENLKKLIKMNFVVTPPREFTDDEFSKLVKHLKKGDNNHAFIEEMYYEIIMSLLEHENKGFELKWNCPNKQTFNGVKITTINEKKHFYFRSIYQKR